MNSTVFENTPQLQTLPAEKLTGKAEKMLSSISAGQVLCIHVGKRGKMGGYLIEPRVDNEGLPALQVFLRSNLADAKISGWEEYQTPTKLPDLEDEPKDTEEETESELAESAQGNDSAADESAKPASVAKKTTKQ